MSEKENILKNSGRLRIAILKLAAKLNPDGDAAKQLSNLDRADAAMKKLVNNAMDHLIYGEEGVNPIPPAKT